MCRVAEFSSSMDRDDAVDRLHGTKLNGSQVHIRKVRFAACRCVEIVYCMLNIVVHCSWYIVHGILFIV